MPPARTTEASVSGRRLPPRSRICRSVLFGQGPSGSDDSVPVSAPGETGLPPLSVPPPALGRAMQGDPKPPRGLAALEFGLCRQQVPERLDAGKIEPSVLERPPGEFTRLRQAAPGLAAQRIEHRAEPQQPA